MEGFDRDIGSVQPAFQKTPEVFYCVCMDVAAHVLDGMIDDFVGIIAFKPNVGEKLISENRASCLDVVSNLALKLVLAPGRNREGAYFSIALHNAHDRSLILRSGSGDFLVTLVDVHVAGLAANEGFIYFDLTAISAELAGSLTLHRKSDSVKHEPRGFLGDSKCSMNLVGADTILAVGDHPNGGQPLVQTKGRIFKDSSDLCGELLSIVLVLAFPNPPSRDKSNVGAFASWAANAIRPSASHDIVKAVLRIREVSDCFDQCLGKCVFVFHEQEYNTENLLCQVYYYPNLDSFGS
jgi:hypothetical protein